MGEMADYILERAWDIDSQDWEQEEEDDYGPPLPEKWKTKSGEWIPIEEMTI